MLWQRDFSVGVTAFSVRVAGFLVGVGGSVLASIVFLLERTVFVMGQRRVC